MVPILEKEKKKKKRKINKKRNKKKTPLKKHYLTLACIAFKMSKNDTYLRERKIEEKKKEKKTPTLPNTSKHEVSIGWNKVKALSSDRERQLRCSDKIQVQDQRQRIKPG